MSSEPEQRRICRLSPTVNVVHFTVRPTPSEHDKMWRAFLFRWPLEIVCDRCAPHHGGQSANPPWLYSWARPHADVVSPRPPAPGTNDALTPLERSGIPLLCTWKRRAVHFRSGPDHIITEGFLDSHDPS